MPPKRRRFTAVKNQKFFFTFFEKGLAFFRAQCYNIPCLGV
jgi:hypothetical protein